MTPLLPTFLTSVATPGLLVLAGTLGGLLNVIAGGGSLVTVPTLLALGLPASLANGTTRPGILLQNAVATLTYVRRGHLSASALRGLWLPSALGAVAGCGAALVSSDALFLRVFAWVMVGCAALLVGAPRAASRPPTPRRPGLLWLGLLVCGAYGGYAQAGVGLALLWVLTRWGGLVLVEANKLKVALVGLYGPITLIFFGAHHIAWAVAGWLALGHALGAYLGSLQVLRRGEPFVRWTLALTSAAVALHLLGAF